MGGETVELPDLYQNALFDFGVFAVGIVKKEKLLPKKTLKKNDV
ncbi:MAG: hypothetical protein CM15mP118_2330 [Alphaproteobacteria bacterium]|nr:MAG: hypothetical protein CM15mP118_2330 [Alphaproteobacteria bacterium]